jgi:hypothetical protein
MMIYDLASVAFGSFSVLPVPTSNFTSSSGSSASAGSDRKAPLPASAAGALRCVHGHEMVSHTEPSPPAVLELEKAQEGKAQGSSKRQCMFCKGNSWPDAWAVCVTCAQHAGVGEAYAHMTCVQRLVYYVELQCTEGAKLGPGLCLGTARDLAPDLAPAPSNQSVVYICRAATNGTWHRATKRDEVVGVV